ncbi:MAG: hypothetical protein WDN28_25405 [Chthoniobacter sp.]
MSITTGAAPAGRRGLVLGAGLRMGAGLGFLAVERRLRRLGAAAARSALQPEVGISTWVDNTYDIGPGYYSFCRVRDFRRAGPARGHYQSRGKYRDHPGTVNITNITYNTGYGGGRVIYDGGPNFAVINRYSERPIPALKLVRNDHFRPRSLARSARSGWQEWVQRPDPWAINSSSRPRGSWRRAISRLPGKMKRVVHRRESEPRLGAE